MSLRVTKFDTISGGPSKEDISKYIERAEPEEQLDWAAVRRIIGNLERKAKKNLQDRDKHATEPEKFMDSEIELDEELHRMNIITTMPEHYYDMARGTALIPTLLSLLAHENTDIACSVLGLLNDISDAEVINEDESGRAEEVIDVLGENSVLQHLVTTIMRLDVSVDTEAEGVVAALGIIENIIEIDPSIILKDDTSHKYLIDWVLRIVISPPPATGTFPQYKLYAAEILDILLHNDGPSGPMCQYTGSTKVYKQKTGTEATDPKDVFNGTHALLKCLAGYRKRDEPSLEEIEYAKNIFNCLCRCLMHDTNRELFLKADGVQLMILLIKRRKLKAPTKNKAKKILLSQFNRLMRESAIRVLSHAVQGQPTACNTLVDSNGLGSVFGIFMLRPKGSEETATEIPGYVLSVLHHCFMYLNQERKTRVLRKFLENDYEKVERLIEFFLKFHTKHSNFMKRVAVQRPQSFLDPSKPMTDEELLLETLSHGLYELQLVVALLAAICTRSRKMLERCEVQLKLNGFSIPQVRSILEELVESLGDPNEDTKIREQKYLKRLLHDFRSQEEIKEEKERKEKQKLERGDAKVRDFEDPTAVEGEVEKDFDEEIAGEEAQDQDQDEEDADEEKNNDVTADGAQASPNEVSSVAADTLIAKDIQSQPADSVPNRQGSEGPANDKSKRSGLADSPQNNTGSSPYSPPPMRRHSLTPPPSSPPRRHRSVSPPQRPRHHRRSSRSPSPRRTSISPRRSSPQRRQYSSPPPHPQRRSPSPTRHVFVSPQRELSPPRRPQILPKPKQQKRSRSPAQRNRDALIQSQPKARSPSPPQHKARSPRPLQRKVRSPSPQQRKARSPSPQQHKARSSSPPPQRRMRSSSPTKRKARSPNLLQRKARLPSPTLRKTTSPSTLDSKMRSPSPLQHKVRPPSPLQRMTKLPSLLKRKARSPSPPQHMTRLFSSPQRKVISPSSPQRKARSPSPLQRKARSPSPPQRKARLPSPMQRKARSPSPIQQLHKAVSPRKQKVRSRSPPASNESSLNPPLEQAVASPPPMQRRARRKSPPPLREVSLSPPQRKARSPSPKRPKVRSPSPVQRRGGLPSPEGHLPLNLMQLRTQPKPTSSVGVKDRQIGIPYSHGNPTPESPDRPSPKPARLSKKIQQGGKEKLSVPTSKPSRASPDLLPIRPGVKRERSSSPPPHERELPVETQKRQRREMAVEPQVASSEKKRRRSTSPPVSNKRKAPVEMPARKGVPKRNASNSESESESESDSESETESETDESLATAEEGDTPEHRLEDIENVIGHLDRDKEKLMPIQAQKVTKSKGTEKGWERRPKAGEGPSLPGHHTQRKDLPKERTELSNKHRSERHDKASHLPKVKQEPTSPRRADYGLTKAKGKLADSHKQSKDKGHGKERLKEREKVKEKNRNKE